jgi:DNA-binding NarL/FixJ family response regulator
MNGLDAAEALLTMLPDVRIVLFTAHDGPEVVRLAQSIGIHAVVAKTRAAATLVAEAQFLMSKRQRREAS